MTTFYGILGIVLFIFIININSSLELLPPGCSGTRSVTCYPIIPSFPQIYGWNLPNMETLKLSNGQNKWTITSLPSGMFNWAQNVKNLYMNDIGLENLPCDIFQPLKNSLERVAMELNIFQDFPTCAFRNLRNLKTINFRNQQIESVKSTDLQLPALTEIDLSNNKISIMNISNLNNKNAIRIELDRNNLIFLNELKLRKISYLSVKENQLEHVQEDIFINSESSLKHLDLSNNKLDGTIWKSLRGLLSLHKLVLRGNRILIVSSSIINSFSELKYLDLSHNQISSLSDVQLRSHQLTHLLLGTNALHEIPAYLISSANSFMPSWSGEIDLSSNMIEKLHLPVPSCHGLCDIRLDSNRLTQLTFDIDSSRLNIFNISNNRFTKIPDRLPRAEHYVISNNPLNTENVVFNLENTMNDAKRIEMENVDLYCGHEDLKFPFIKLSNIYNLNMKNNCVPLEFLCSINITTNPTVILDNNENCDVASCRLDLKEFKSLSINNCGCNLSVFKYFTSEDSISLENVNSFHLSNNNFERLPSLKLIQSSHFPTYLDLRMNSISVVEGISVIVSEIRNEFTLNFENNNLTHIEPIVLLKQNNGHSFVLFNFRWSIIYRNNEIITIKDSIIFWKHYPDIRYLFGEIMVDLSFNKMKILNLSKLVEGGNIDNMRNIFHLNISNNHLTKINGCVQIYSIEKLDLSHNMLDELPNDSCQFGKYLYIGHNKITNITIAVPSMSIELLDLRWNLIDMIANNAFSRLSDLRTLNLKGNKLTVFPKAIQTLSQLTTLDISFNKIKSLTQSNIDGKFKFLKTIILSGNILTPKPANNGIVENSNIFTTDDNYMTCDCSMLFLRNNTLQAEGRCSFPPEVEGYHVSCFPIDNCVGFVPLYQRKETIAKCQSDTFIGFKLSVEETPKVNIIRTTRIGPLTQLSIHLEGFNQKMSSISRVLNDSNKICNFVIDRDIKMDRICLRALFKETFSYERCFDVKVNSRVHDEISNNNLVYGISGILSLSLVVNIAAITVFFIRRKRKATENSSRVANNANPYEIPSVHQHRQSSNYDEVAQ